MKRLPLSLRWNSLFVKLLSSFLLLVVLLLSFNLFSFAFFKTNIHEDIVSYNMLGMAKSVESYEKHFSLIEINLLQLGLSRPIAALDKSADNYDYNVASQAIEKIRTLTGNPLLFINNIFLYAANRPFFLEKNGTGKTSELFVKQYVSTTYDTAFWAKELPGNASTFRFYPAAHFYSDIPINGVSDKGNLFPIAVQSGSYTILSFLDAGSLFDRFHVSSDGHFVILDSAGKLLFRNDDTADVDLSAVTFSAGEGHVRIGDNYLFYRKGVDTGFTYINIVPFSHLASQISRLNTVLAAVLGSALLIGFLLSVALSIKFNRPIRKMISGF
ncbi:hypothetical protein ACFFNY_32595 [Paenibacillus hodogayensis]|uniref:Cache domain-containing protein n=1 Tax=Paenibacillus hodogayensis TaxID=279208 RepID=A0ABV5W7G3_9BACL